ncbi:MAG: hypothetical protein WA948_02270 [Pontixanthobacter sp.]
MAQWYKLPTTMRTSHAEYRANIDGIKIVFGAVLGFVLAGTESLITIDFMYVLLVSATAVTSILYLGSSHYKLCYTVLTVIFIALIPDLIEHSLELPPIPKLQPTLIVWALMVLVLELLPREAEPKPVGTHSKENPE